MNNSMLTPEFLEHVAERFRVLGDPSRLEILQALMGGPLAVTEVVRRTGKGQANVSKHLGVLSAAGIVSRRRSGNHAIYEVADTMVFRLCELVCGSVKKRLTMQVRKNERLLRKS